MRQLTMDLLDRQQQPPPVELDAETRQVVIDLLAEAMVAAVSRQTDDQTGGGDEPDRQ